MNNPVETVAGTMKINNVRRGDHYSPLTEGIFTNQLFRTISWIAACACLYPEPMAWHAKLQTIIFLSDLCLQHLRFHVPTSIDGGFFSMTGTLAPAETGLDAGALPDGFPITLVNTVR